MLYFENEAVGCNCGGYLTIRIRNKTYYVHRIIYEMHRGDTNLEVDHRDRNKENNDIDNLRPATRSQNVCNNVIRADNASGYKGVCYHKATRKWNAQINIGANKRKSLGFFNTPEEAALTYNKAAIELHGEFAYQNEVSNASV
jgi:hypothetical protein